MTTTIIERNDGKIISRTGTSGFTLTATRTDNDLDVRMEFDQATINESVGMVGALLAQLEEMYGESYVTACLGHYARDTGKKFMEAGDHKIVMIRGGTRGKPPTGRKQR